MRVDPGSSPGIRRCWWLSVVRPPGFPVSPRPDRGGQSSMAGRRRVAPGPRDQVAGKQGGEATSFSPAIPRPAIPRPAIPRFDRGIQPAPNGSVGALLDRSRPCIWAGRGISRGVCRLLHPGQQCCRRGLRRRNPRPGCQRRARPLPRVLRRGREPDRNHPCLHG